MEARSKSFHSSLREELSARLEQVQGAFMVTVMQFYF